MRPQKKTSHKKILIVEDDVEMSEMLAEYLTFSGLDVFLASDGTQALDALATLTPDLIMTDMQLPTVPGSEFIAEIRKSEKTKTLPVIVASANINLESEVEELDIQGFLRKPFRLDEVKNLIERCLRKSASPLNFV